MSKPNLRAVDNQQITLKGWIQPCERGVIDVDAARNELKSCGVEVGAWDMFAREFQDCVVSMAALERLDPMWGKYIWGLS